MREPLAWVPKLRMFQRCTAEAHPESTISSRGNSIYCKNLFLHGPVRYYLHIVMILKLYRSGSKTQAFNYCSKFGSKYSTYTVGKGQFSQISTFFSFNPETLVPHIRNSLGYLKKLKFIISRGAIQFGLSVPLYLGAILLGDVAGYMVF